MRLGTKGERGMTKRKCPIHYEGVLEEMEKKYNSRLGKYGESWKTCDLSYLVEKLRGEIEEFEKAEESWERLREAVDIANMSSMILARALGHGEREER